MERQEEDSSSNNSSPSSPEAKRVRPSSQVKLDLAQELEFNDVSDDEDDDIWWNYGDLHDFWMTLINHV